MRIVQITPGAGGMYCGNCFRDNALVRALRSLGHETLMIPLYLPMTLDEEDQSAGTPIFFGGINVYLGQKSALFRNMPSWLHNVLSSPKLLKWAAGRAAKTKAEDVGELTLSMLRGEEGNQARELEGFIAWLKDQPKPDLICLSNALLAGMVRKLKAELNVPVIVMLQGEDSFLDSLPEDIRGIVWQTLAERCAEVDYFIAPSQYFGELMRRRLALPQDRLAVVWNGINLEGYPAPDSLSAQNTPTLGYFARMCREKGLHTLVEAFILLRKNNRVPNLRLRVGGGCGPSDEIFLDELRSKLSAEGLLEAVEFRPNVSREEKIQFFSGLTAFSVPALYGEAFGLYVIEAMAAGLPVVQPRTASFPELVAATGGGILCEPGSAAALAEALELLLSDPARARALGEKARDAVRQSFTVHAMTRNLLGVYEAVLARSSTAKTALSK
jgi:glycosyltransferase involved in cell wall biosynthesis